MFGLNVRLQIARVYEGPFADIAHIGLLSCVCAHVRDEVTLLGGSVGADRTGERFFPGMDSHVTHQSGRTAEGLVTRPARE